MGGVGGKQEVEIGELDPDSGLGVALKPIIAAIKEEETATGDLAVVKKEDPLTITVESLSQLKIRLEEYSKSEDKKPLMLERGGMPIPVYRDGVFGNFTAEQKKMLGLDSRINRLSDFIQGLNQRLPKVTSELAEHQLENKTRQSTIHSLHEEKHAGISFSGCSLILGKKRKKRDEWLTGYNNRLRFINKKPEEAKNAIKEKTPIEKLIVEQPLLKHALGMSDTTHSHARQQLFIEKEKLYDTIS